MLLILFYLYILCLSTKRGVGLTIVEFFDRNAVENIVSALVCAPERVVLVGDNDKRLKRNIAFYKTIARNRGLEIEFIPKKTSRNDLAKIIKDLTDIVETYDDCVFDLEGGEELFLVAIGILYNTYSDRIQLHKFNFSSGVLIDCDNDGNTCETNSVEMTIDEVVRAAGGRVLTIEDDGQKGEFISDNEFYKDVRLMWEICTEDTLLWNNMITSVAKLYADFKTSNPLEFCASMGGVSSVIKKNNVEFADFIRLLKEFDVFGVIKGLFYNSSYLSFEFKDLHCLRCLTIAGKLLELVVAFVAENACDNNGKPIYNDVRSGVFIDWDLQDASAENISVTNEVDVVMMKGLIPVYISCKNGLFNVNELYKLAVVAEHFGGKYSKKAIFVSEMISHDIKGQYIMARAKEMGIVIVEDVDRMSTKDFEETIGKIWRINI